MTEITQTELSRVLALDPGEEADAAFARHVMDWEHHISGTTRESLWIKNDSLMAYGPHYKPTQGDANAWWAGVEKLRERFVVNIGADAETYFADVATPDFRENFSQMHANPAVSLLRAACEAIYASQEDGK